MLLTICAARLLLIMSNRKNLNPQHQSRRNLVCSLSQSKIPSLITGFVWILLTTFKGAFIKVDSPRSIRQRWLKEIESEWRLRDSFRLSPKMHHNRSTSLACGFFS